MPRRAKIAVIGGGILGLAHAYTAARRGHSVTLFERGHAATGASIRNFGMIWPIGQPPGEMHQMALRSREIWTEVLSSARLSYLPTGSLHVAYHDDEAEVLREFAAIAPPAGYNCEWLDASGVLERSDAVQPRGLKGGVWSAAELTVDPRLVIRRLPSYLRELGVAVKFGSAVTRIDLPRVETGAESFEADLAVVCSGDDFETLFPGLFRASELTRCKLQMMRTAARRLAVGSGASCGVDVAILQGVSNVHHAWETEGAHHARKTGIRKVSHSRAGIADRRWRHHARGLA